MPTLWESTLRHISLTSTCLTCRLKESRSVTNWLCGWRAPVTSQVLWSCDPPRSSKGSQSLLSSTFVFLLLSHKSPARLCADRNVGNEPQPSSLLRFSHVLYDVLNLFMVIITVIQHLKQFIVDCTMKFVLIQDDRILWGLIKKKTKSTKSSCHFVIVYCSNHYKRTFLLSSLLPVPYLWKHLFRCSHYS